MPSTTPTCRHLHTDGRPCGSPALRGEPFCFHHHTARQPMPKRNDPANARLLTPQLPAPDDFPAIQRGIGEVLRLLVNDRLTDLRAQALLRGLAIASQNLARMHRREEKLAAAGQLPEAVTAYINHPRYGTIALDPEAPDALDEQPSTGETGLIADPIPVLTPDPSPQTSYDEAKTVEINNYFQDIYDKRAARFEEHAQRFEHEKSLELEALYDTRHADLQADFERRLAEIAIQQNQYLRTSEEMKEHFLALAS